MLTFSKVGTRGTNVLSNSTVRIFLYSDSIYGACISTVDCQIVALDVQVRFLTCPLKSIKMKLLKNITIGLFVTILSPIFGFVWFVRSLLPIPYPEYSLHTRKGDMIDGIVGMTWLIWWPFVYFIKFITKKRKIKPNDSGIHRPQAAEAKL